MSAPDTQAANAPAATPLPTEQPSAKPKTSSAFLLIRTVIRQGDIILYENIETEDGGTMSLNLAQYVKYDLDQDELRFADEMYNRILDEAVAHSNDEGFNTEQYFTMHPDYAVSAFAIKACEDEAIVSESLRHEQTIEELRDQVNHLLLDFRGEYINQKLTALRTEMQQCQGDKERMTEAMRQMQELQKVRMEIAKRTGRTIHR